MREISEIDITQTYFTPATTAVSLRVLVNLFIYLFFFYINNNNNNRYIA